MGRELVGRKAEPHVALLAQAFVVVGQVVDDDDDAAGPQQARAGREQLRRARGVVQGAGDDDDGGAALAIDRLVYQGIAGVAFEQPHVAESGISDDARTRRKTRGAAIDSEDAGEERSQERQQHTVAGADVDAQALKSLSEQRPQQRQKAKQRRRRRCRRRGSLFEEGPRSLLATAQNAGNAREALVLATQATPLLEGRRHDGFVDAGGAWLGLEIGAGAVFARREQSRRPQGLQLARDLGLGLGQELGQLGDGQLLLGTQGVEAQPILVTEEAKEIGARLRLEHSNVLCIHTHVCNEPPFRDLLDHGPTRRQSGRMSTSPSTLRIESLAIGDELLDGRVQDSNTKNLGDALSVLGLELQGARTVPDDRALIIAALQEAVARADVVVTSGGLGPTSDDVTAECIAAAKGEGLRFDEPAFARMSAMFAAREIPMPESNRRQAMLPSSSSSLENQMGTAPGFITPFAVQMAGGAHTMEVWSFPGVPREYEHLRDTFLLPALQARLAAGAPRLLVRRTLRCLGLAESAIGERLGPLERDNPDVRVQYRAAFPEIVVRLVLTAQGDVAAVEARADALCAAAHAAIGKSVWGVGDDPLEVRVLAALRRNQLSVATAESCTGGLIAKRLTDVAGSSDVVLGGVVSYANTVKTAALGVSAATLEKHGAVSAPVAVAMAQGARERLGAGVAIAVTGIAGPGGGSADKPVGTVWFGLSTSTSTTSVLKKFPDFGRERVREMAAATALRLLLDALDGAM